MGIKGEEVGEALRSVQTKSRNFSTKVLEHAERRDFVACLKPIGTPFLLNIIRHQGQTRTMTRTFLSGHISRMRMNPYFLQKRL